MLCFWSGVYGTSLGRTKNWSIGAEDAKSLVGLHGILIGVGEIVGGIFFLKILFLTNNYLQSNWLPNPFKFISLSKM